MFGLFKTILSLNGIQHCKLHQTQPNFSISLILVILVIFLKPIFKISRFSDTFRLKIPVIPSSRWKGSKFHIFVSKFNMRSSWFTENVLTVHDLQSFVLFVVFFVLVYVVGKQIFKITSSLWGSFVFIMALYFGVTPTSDNPIFQVLQKSIESFDDSTKI